MASATWTAGTTANWSTTADWTGGSGTGGIPGTNDDVSLPGFATAYTVTIDSLASPTPSLDSLTVGGAFVGGITLNVGASTLNVNGAATDQINLAETGGATLQLAGGTVNTTNLVTSSTAGAAILGFGTLNVTGNVQVATGTAKIQASGGVLDVKGGGLGSIPVSVALDIGALAADNATLKIDDQLTAGTPYTFTFVTGSTGATLNLFNVATTGAIAETIANLNVGTSNTVPTDKIDFSGATVSIINQTGNTGTSGTVTLSTGTNQITLTLQGLNPGGWIAETAPDAGTGTNVFLACYARGTRILTEDGEVPVEDLKIGDAVVTFSGAARPIRWIGTRVYDGRFVAGNRMVLPIRVAAGALSEGVPSRDLFVSPLHSLYFDHVLVPAEQLVNGVTIEQVQDVDRVEYFHIELDSHDVIIAEGAPAETFVDCDNRGMFQNSADYALLYPDDERPHWEFCAPRLEQDSLELTAIRARLWERATALIPGLETDPNLHLVADGKTIWPDLVRDCLYRFTVPAGSAAVSLGSLSIVPAEVTDASRDIRRLGVPVERIALSDADLSIEVWHGHEALADGFHGDEDTHRWTNGLARLPRSWAGLFAGEFTLEVRLAPGRLDYRAAEIASTRNAA